MTFKQILTHRLLNIIGWRTKRHYVVIESDDWGSIRMPSKEVYQRLLNYGIRVDKCHYCSNDSVAREDDLSLLFEILNSVNDKYGGPAVITANAVVSNPDFQKIKEGNYKHYYNKLITEDIPSIKGCEHSLDLWKEGNVKGFFRLQSHGREHLNVTRWMNSLKQGLPETLKAFELGVYGISTTITSENRRSYLPAFDFQTAKEEAIVNNIAEDGLALFENLFGFKSKSFIAPNYVWGSSLEESLAKCGVKFIQGQHAGAYVRLDGERRHKRLRYIGKQNHYGQIDLVRNAFFEPSENPDKDWVDTCLTEIKEAFNWHHPAIICSHRVNFIGALNLANRDRNLKHFRELLQRIVIEWPDVEFVSSDTLGEIITKDVI